MAKGTMYALRVRYVGGNTVNYWSDTPENALAHFRKFYPRRKPRAPRRKG